MTQALEYAADAVTRAERRWRGSVSITQAQSDLVARAVFETMRVMTPEMRAAAVKVCEQVGWQDLPINELVECVWVTAIQEALGENEEIEF